LILMGLCIAATLPLEAAGARVWRSPRRVLRALAIPLALFLLWDVVAIVRGTWWFSPSYTTGWDVGRVPVEEIVFFVVVPLCSLLTFETVRRLLRRA